MARLLSNADIEKTFGTIILNADSACLRPNSYILRLGGDGEFLNTRKTFELGTDKKGIIIPPGYSVGLSAIETINFSYDAVHAIFPNCAIHGFISPTTDLSREGLVAPTTQVDAGFIGALNWTVANTSNEERRFVMNERLFRLTLFLLEEGEVPTSYYDGDYQGRTGYNPSARKGAPTGMRESEWATPDAPEGPESILDELLNAGYPWQALGKRLQDVELQFKSVSEGYGGINNLLQSMKDDINTIKASDGELQKELPQLVQNSCNQQVDSYKSSWLISSTSTLVVIIGLILTITGNTAASDFVETHAIIIGLAMVLLGVIVLAVMQYRNKKL